VVQEHWCSSGFANTDLDLLLKEATADYSDEEMHAALDINIPNYATAVVTTEEIVQAIT
jgi:hypothetical protein